MTPVSVHRASRRDVGDLALLKWSDLHGSDLSGLAGDEYAAFVTALSDWWSTHGDRHAAFLSSDPSGAPIGAAWVALVPRVPRPGELDRLSGDVQSVYVVPEHRGRGVGTVLVDAAVAWAMRSGASRVTVHSSERAVSLYRRRGFAPSHRLMQRHTP